MLVRIVALLVGCMSVAVAAGHVESQLRSQKTPGILSSGPRGGPSSVTVLGFTFAGSKLPSSSQSRCAKCTKYFIHSTQGLRTLRASHLVTYGDIWRNALDEPNPELQIENEMMKNQPKGVSVTGLNQEFEIENAKAGTAIGSVVRPVARAANVVGAAAAGAAANMWATLTKGPSDEELQENLRRWARSHGGAVLPPLEDGELESEVRFVGMFPELVETMLEAEIERETFAPLPATEAADESPQ